MREDFSGNAPRAATAACKVAESDTVGRMAAASRFVEALKKSVRARGLTYAELARRLQLSEASVKRMFSRGTFTLARIEEVLDALDLDLYDVARMSRGGNGGAVQLTHEQELGLARDERLLAVFWLVLNGWRFEEIVATLATTRAELTLAFARLEKLELIEWGPRERVRLRVPRDFAWRPGGPAKKAYARRAMAEFLAGRFDAPLELIRFEPRELSLESAAALKRKLERLLAEFTEMAEADSALPSGRRVAIGLLAACRPWEFSAVHALKRRKAS
jgi:transcriptional regulator with XRE-family HTH domain